MKKRISKRNAFILSLTSIIAFNLMYYFSTQQSLLAAPVSQGYEDILANPSVNKVGNSGSDAEIPGDYGFMLKVQDDTTYEGINPSQVAQYRTSQSNIYRFTKGSSLEQGVWIRNAGFYNGEKIDVKLVIDSLNFKNNPYFNFFALNPSEKGNTSQLPTGSISKWEEAYFMVGSSSLFNSGFYDTYTTGDTAEYHYEFYDQSGARINIKGSWNYNNINSLKSVSVPFQNDFENIYVKQDSWIGYKTDTPAAGELELYGETENMNDEKSRLTYLYSGNSYATNMIFRGTSDNRMGVLYSNESLARIAPATPIVIGEKNSAGNAESDYLELRYSILQNVMDNKKENRNSSVIINTETPDFYSIDSIKVYEFGRSEDVSGRFNITMTDNKAVLEAIDPTSDAFNGQIYEIKVIAKKNSKFSFDKVLYNYQTGGVDDGHMIFEEGGPKTTTSYKYNDPTNISIIKFEGTLEAEVVDGQSQAKVRYDGVPSADAREDVAYPVGTDFGSLTQQEIEDTLIENISVDTGNIPLDEITSIVIDDTRLPDTSTPGEKIIYVVLTTKQGVSTTVAVPVTLGQASADLTVRFVDADGNDIVGYTPVVITGVIGETVDLTREDDVTNVLDALTLAGYDIKQPDGRPTNEAAVEFVEGGSEVKYVLTKAAGTVTVEFYYMSKQGVETVVQEAAPVVLTNKEVGTSLDLTLESSVTDAISAIVATGRYTLLDTGRPSDETAVIVERTAKTVKYIFTGQLKLESVPTLDFRKQSVTATDGVKVDNPSLIENENYTAADNVDNKDKLIVSDYRSVANGWTLSVKLLSPLLPDEENPDMAYVLADAIRYDTGSEEVIITEELRDIVSETHEGQYDVSSTWTPAGKGFKLELPAGAVNKMGKYKATMQYVLANTP
ncbi:WxL domain-containing protein [Enterococcus sp. BWM-S5]|uniref:WxL domain-containing protein n=1 Tax=Enterococcus larvae TaxID=2794352 RepID=A0ABS4CNA3_9ENTE|nr:WxL domain-containing protein [Enterococcus larvae]MBP1047515.1 WxL domain-containing protein [Enterococcus larvae]